jgi:hypothetical protein
MPVLHGVGTSSPMDALRALTAVRSLAADKRSCHRERVVPHACHDGHRARRGTVSPITTGETVPGHSSEG